jgi:hypothetical protein
MRCGMGFSSHSKSDGLQYVAGDAICVRRHAYPEQGNVSKIYRSSQSCDASSRRVEIGIHMKIVPSVATMATECSVAQ